ncbi:OmpA family protein [Azospirillum sp. SYSU D00513]|uniref:OmpA family protein n=1 Tax=Azospirillum sp. SYSU D00513 TaxID=2812561 RepID=UPI001A96AC64|nr:OmpA family protein [Azospirillum sp. SYSU D00513]
MNKLFRSGLALVPAALVAGMMIGAAPAQAQTATTGEWCNPVIGWNNVPVRTASGGYAIHQGSFKCPATAAAPAPATTAPVQTEYLVFFDWDKSNITPAAERVIGDAVAAIGAGNAARIHVIGHTDTSGSPAYNQRLSNRRAEAVKQALAARGVPASNITTEGRGETQLLVQTGPNVREPSNRRAQILPRTGAGS